MGRKTFTFIAETATETNQYWTNREVVQFHYFNANGAMAKWHAMCDTIGQYVDAGTVHSGWHLAYGSLSSFAADKVIALHDQKRISSIELEVAVKMLNDATNTGYTKLAEMILGE